MDANVQKKDLSDLVTQITATLYKLSWVILGVNVLAYLSLSSLDTKEKFLISLKDLILSVSVEVTSILLIYIFSYNILRPIDMVRNFLLSVSNEELIEPVDSSSKKVNNDTEVYKILIKFVDLIYNNDTQRDITHFDLLPLVQKEIIQKKDLYRLVTYINIQKEKYRNK